MQVLDSIFAADSALMRVLSKFADVVVLNLVFVLTSLPVLTLGASLTALHATARRIVQNRTEGVAGDYLHAFRSNLKSGSALLGALAGLGVVLGAWYVVVNSFVVNPTAQLILLAGWLVIVLQFLATCLFAFPYLATFDDPTPRVLRNALLMSWRHPLTAAAAALLVGLPIVLTIFYPHATVYGLLWFAFGFGAIATLTQILFTRVFAHYLPAPRPEPASQDGTARAHS